jgi:adhesin HecA-like repeat protein
MGTVLAKALRQTTFLGPGLVTEVLAAPERAVMVSLGGSEVVRAELAVAYEPAVDDTLLVIGTTEYYVIGVLAGRGKHVLVSHGDVVVHAVGGALELRGDTALRMTAPSVDVNAGTLRTVARSVVEAFATLHQRVADLLSTHAGQSHTVVEREAITQARSAAIQTEDTVTINGKQIHLG